MRVLYSHVLRFCTAWQQQYRTKRVCNAGEVFGGISVPAGSNDAQSLLQALANSSVQSVFNRLRGPWSAVYWHHSSRTLWFGKDVLGMTLCHAIVEDQVLLWYTHSIRTSVRAGLGHHVHAVGNIEEGWGVQDNKRCRRGWSIKGEGGPHDLCIAAMLPLCTSKAFERSAFTLHMTV